MAITAARFSRLLPTALILFSSALVLAAAQSPQRIHANISDDAGFTLPGNVRPSIARAQDQGEVAGSMLMSRMSIHFSMTASQQADLLQLARLQQTKDSDQFHKWLTPEQFADRFGMNAKDIQRVTAWLESMGFSNIQAARSRNVISFDGTATQAQSAFHTSIHQYVLNGHTHYANATAPELPKALNGVVAGIRGLHDFHPHPRARPHFTSSISGNHYLAPDDFATIYDIKALYGAGIDGTGWTIAVPGQTDIITSDISSFRAAAGLSATLPTVVLDGRDPGTRISSGDLGETDLDLEWAGAIAKGATLVYVESTDVFTSVTYAVTNNLADVIPITYGACEADTGQAEINTLNNVFLQAATEGITLISASGDAGAADCDGDDTTVPAIASLGPAVDFPPSSPYVTGVGGTTFNDASGGYWSSTNNASNGSAISYIPEVAWNDTAANNQLSASGGGVSTVFSKPTWQTGPGVPNDGFRDVPDVALAASPDNDGYMICSTENGETTPCVNGFRFADTTLNVTGGTSCGAPTFAAIVALLDQKLGSRQGNINANLYTLASVSTDAFHDITSGDNIVTCVGGTTGCSSQTTGTNGTFGYSTGPGYDQVTGLGSIDAYHLVNEWPVDLKLSINPTSINVARGTSGVATVSVTESNYSGPVTFTCFVNTPITNTTCSVAGTVTGSGTTTLTITAGASASTPWWHRIPQIPSGPSLLWIFTALLLAVSTCFLTRHEKVQVCSAAFGLLLVIGLSSCGSGSSSSTTTVTTSTPSTTAETATVRVVGVSGNFTSSATVSVTVK